MPKIDPNGPLAGRAALVTGASRGIGEAIAVRLAMAGAKVVVTARTAEAGDSKLSGSLHETVERIRAGGGEAAFIKADITSPEEREALVRQAAEQFGPTDILVNNAAVLIIQTVANYTDKRLKLMMDVCVNAPFHLSQLVLPAMREAGRGAIVNISSGASAHPKPADRRARGQTVYGMTKAALERFSTGLAAEVSSQGVSVNAVSPGMVATPGLVANVPLTDEALVRTQPINVIAEAVFQIVSRDPAAMTGRVDKAADLLDELKVQPTQLI